MSLVSSVPPVRLRVSVLIDRNLCVYNDDNKRALVAAGGLGPLVRMVAEDPVTGAERAAGAIRDLCATVAEHRDAAARAGTLPCARSPTRDRDDDDNVYIRTHVYNVCRPRGDSASGQTAGKFLRWVCRESCWRALGACVLAFLLGRSS